MSAARKAIELDPELAEPHVLLGETYQRQWQWSEAEAEYKRALELNPNDAGRTNICDVAPVPGADGRGPWRGPSVPTSLIRLEAPAAHEWLHFVSRQTLRGGYPGIAKPPGRLDLAFALIANGQPDEAITVLEKALAGSGREFGYDGRVGRAYAHAGRRADALRLLNELKRRQQKGYVPSAAFVNAYLGLGDNEQAFVWLERPTRNSQTFWNCSKCTPTLIPCAAILVLKT